MRPYLKKKLSQKKRIGGGGAGGVAQGVDPEFKLQYCKKKKHYSLSLCVIFVSLSGQLEPSTDICGDTLISFVARGRYALYHLWQLENFH
jgi:hypothetical protein